jgi:hypothetical protein
VIEVAAQVPQDFQPPDQSQESERQTWLTYAGELRAWCTQYSPASLDLCLQTEMAKYGLSPEFFAALQGQSQDANDPLPVTPEAPAPVSLHDPGPVTPEAPAPVSLSAVPAPDSAPALHGWTWTCRTDPISNAWTCGASQADLHVAIVGYARKPLVWIADDRQRMPGSLSSLRLDEDTAYQTRQMWTGASAHTIITRMLTAQVAHTRYAAWPSDQGVDGTVSLAGFAEVWRALQQALRASQ